MNPSHPCPLDFLRVTRRLCLGLLTAGLCAALSGCFLWADDDDGGSSEASIRYTDEDARYTQNVPITPNRVIDENLLLLDHYEVAPALPAGLVLDGSFGDIFGTPELVVERAAYVVRAVDPSGATLASRTIHITVLPLTPPTNLRYSNNPASYPAEANIADNLPSNDGGLIARYEVSPPLPAGLRLEQSSGKVRGRPTTVQEEQSYTITGSNIAGSTSVELRIAVTNSARARTVIVLDGDQPLASTYRGRTFPGNAYQEGYTELPRTAVRCVADPQGRFVWTLDSASNILRYTQDPRGHRMLAGTVVATPNGAYDLAIDPRGQQLVALAGGVLRAYDIAADGSLSNERQATTSDGPTQVVADARGHAYVANGFAGTISVYSIEAGILRDLGAVAAGAYVSRISLPVARDLAFALDFTGQEVRSFVVRPQQPPTTAADHLIPTGTPLALPAPVVDLKAAADGLSVLTCSAEDSLLRIYDVAEDGTLAESAEPLFAGESPAQIEIDAASRLVYVLDTGSRELRIYGDLPGGMVLRDRSRTPEQPGFFCLCPGVANDGFSRHALLTSATNSTLQAFRFSRSDASIAATPQGPVATGAGPTDVVLHPDLDVVYTADREAGRVSIFHFDPETGTLTPADPPSVAAGTNPSHILLHPTGRAAFVLDDAGALLHFDVDGNGDLSLNQNIALGFVASGIAVEPTGRSLYLTNLAASTIHHHRIDPISLALSDQGVTAAVSSPNSIQISPQGRFAYVSSRDSNSVAQFSVQVGGALSFLTPPSVPANTQLFEFQQASDSFSACAASAVSGDLRIYLPDRESGQLAEIGAGPLSVPDVDAFVISRANPSVLIAQDGPAPSLGLYESQPNSSLQLQASIDIAPGPHALEVDVAPFQ